MLKIMIDLYLITGFLGSGKTTLLGEIAKRAQEQSKRYIFLVNEFSAKDIDGERIQSLGGDALIVPGGSIFCACLASDFITKLSEIPKVFGHSPFDALVVEASGIANPSAIDKLLHETQMDKIYKLGRIISMADATTLPKILKTLPAAKSQLSASDYVLLNKCDLHSEDVLFETEQLISKYTSAPIERVSYAKFKDGLLDSTKTSMLEGQMSFCVDPAFAHHHIVFQGNVDLDYLNSIFTSHIDEIYRAKGTLNVNGDFVMYDFSSGRVDVKVSIGKSQNEIVIITKSNPSDKLLKKLDSLKQY